MEYAPSSGSDLQGARLVYIYPVRTYLTNALAIKVFLPPSPPLHARMMLYRPLSRQLLNVCNGSWLCEYA